MPSGCICEICKWWDSRSPGRNGSERYVKEKEFSARELIGAVVFLMLNFVTQALWILKKQKIRQRHVKLDLYNACILFIHPHMMFAMCPMLLLNTFIGWSVFRLKVTPLGCQLIDSMTLTPVVFESCWNEKTHKHHTVDGWNLANHLACKKPVVNNGIFNYQSQLVCSPDWNAINSIIILNSLEYMSVSKNTGTPKWMVKINENNGKPY